MKAVQMVGPGGPEVLAVATVPEPTSGPGDVLVAVELAGVNFADINARRAVYAGRGVPFRPGLGLEVYGRVASVGDAVTDLAVGDRVAGLSSTPGYAELAVCDRRLVWRVPDRMSDLQAAAFPVVGLTALHLLRSAARLTVGESVLVTAAAGGVGGTAVQIARVLGAGMVVGAAGSRQRADHALTLGADAAIDYSRTRIAEGLTSAGLSAVDVALDAVGGTVRADVLDCLAPFGRLVQYGNSSGQPEELPDARSLRDRLVSVGGMRLTRLRTIAPELLRAGGEELLPWLAAGRVRIPVAEILPLAAAAEAHRRLESRQVIGKLLLAVGGR